MRDVVSAVKSKAIKKAKQHEAQHRYGKSVSFAKVIEKGHYTSLSIMTKANLFTQTTVHCLNYWSNQTTCTESNNLHRIEVDMAFRLLYTAHGRYTATYTFEDEETAMSWNAAVLEIKAVIEQINLGLQNTGRDGQGTMEDYQPWLTMVERLINNHGSNKVPKDIQRAYNSVERGLGLPVTQWP